MDISEIIKSVDDLRKRAHERAKLLKNEIEKINDISTDGLTIGSVDGGLLKKSYHPFDIIVVRSIGVVYTYNDGISVHYFPSKFPKKEIMMYNGKELKFFSNLNRVEREIKTSVELMKKFNLDALILDGSIVPHPSLRPNKDSEFYEKYEKIIEMYEKLYEMCKDCILAGVVKDSRSSHYDNEFRDTFLLSFALNEGEKTKSFRYQETNTSDIASSDKIFSFYMKSNKASRPIRVDFLGRKNEDKVAGLIFKLSKFSSVGIPNIILECDKRVKLSQTDLYGIERRIFSRMPANFFLRRNGHLF